MGHFCAFCSTTDYMHYVHLMQKIVKSLSIKRTLKISINIIRMQIVRNQKPWNMIVVLFLFSVMRCWNYMASHCGSKTKQYSRRIVFISFVLFCCFRRSTISIKLEISLKIAWIRNGIVCVALVNLKAKLIFFFYK